ncbi:hypothetical protein LNAOJCKE_1431 [Methylorubrum aminovorans]|uniref:DUF3306 domain-containing protein n=1 Tax=Methylorubrum aminovorans TaxID=269069 RepID=A0ABQ4UAD7_9HYPH|nr:DUF3306 domain-containing protein [Methylorubrum aminovorans]GJE64231.1 hypothetical protein LNAOJCKE_1431 [Methylorubrum aminovorans]GMA76726.1 hypothetical protein GCM10025880_31430 [Methylorubrum aminovorans]
MSGTFLSRWARRKEAVRAAELSELPVAADTAATGEALAAALSDETAPPMVAEADAGSEPASAPDDLLASLPSLDDLTPETDLTAFLQAGVPTALRNAALRRMWSLDPAIRDFVSEAREYAYDWNTPGGVPGMGPLLPTDDVKAMLKRVIDGIPTKEVEEPEAATDEAATASEEDPAAPVGADTSELAAITQAEEASPPAVDSQPLNVSVPDNRLEAVQPTPQRPRLRRHGGAMPS